MDWNRNTYMHIKVSKDSYYYWILAWKRCYSFINYKNILVYPWFEPVPAPSKISLHLVIETRLFRPQGYFPLAAVIVLNSTINIHMYFAQAIYRLNIMFRHMPVPRDTSVSRQIIIVCCESVGNCQTLSKDGPSQLVSTCSTYFVLFFFSLRPMSIVSY